MPVPATFEDLDDNEERNKDGFEEDFGSHMKRY